MVSSALNMDLQDLLDGLERLRLAADPEYRKWREQFPSDWPI